MGVGICHHETPYFGLKDFKFAPPPGSAKELAAVPGGHPGVLGDPLQPVPIQVSEVVAVVLLTLLLPKALAWKERQKRDPKAPCWEAGTTILLCHRGDAGETRGWWEHSCSRQLLPKTASDGLQRKGEGSG